LLREILSISGTDLVLRVQALSANEQHFIGASVLAVAGGRRSLALPPRVFNLLEKVRSKRYVLASNGYLELGMFDAAAHKRHREVLDAVIAVYLGTRDWHKAVATAADLVKAEPKNSSLCSESGGRS
jgi:hypothetical protein